MRRALPVTLLSLALLAVVAPAAMAHDGGEGTWGETNDKVITNAGFILMIVFVGFVFLASMLQGALDRRKERRKAAEKARRARADMRGGW